MRESAENILLKLERSHPESNEYKPIYLSHKRLLIIQPCHLAKFNQDVLSAVLPLVANISMDAGKVAVWRLVSACEFYCAMTPLF
jgi:hypothetical protein